MAAVINEFFFNNAGTDTLEYIEIYFPTAYAGDPLYVLQIEGDVAANITQRGRVDSVHAVAAAAAGGYTLLNLAPNTLENGAFTLLLVASPTLPGTAGSDDGANDFDADNDGVLDAAFPYAILDAVGIADDAADSTYAGAVRLTNSTGSVGGFSRIPNGSDTNTNADWMPNDQALDPNDDSDPTPDVGEARNTPGAANQREAAGPPPAIVVGVPVSSALAEGGAGSSFTVVLSARPTADVTIAVTPDAQLDTDLDQLVFTPANWNVPQRVTVTAIDDTLVEGTHGGSVVLGAAVSADPTYAGQNPLDPAFSITDNDAPGATLTVISAIQGAGHTSPLVGQTVTTSGIVIARDTSGTAANGQRGFYIMDPVGDGDDATSEGLFVAVPSGGLPTVGDALTVSGTVNEFLVGGAATNLTTTRLVGASWTVDSTGNALPGVTIGAGGLRPPPAIIEDDGFTSFDIATDGIDFYESLEGMRVTVTSTKVTGPTNRFGETWVYSQDQPAGPTTARGGLLLGPADANPERIQLQTDTGITPGISLAANVGDTLGSVTGVLRYDFGNYELALTQQPVVANTGVVPEATLLDGTSNTILVANYNAENLAATDAQSKFDALAAQIVGNLNTPDILALQEVQDNNGTTNNGIVAADLTLARLIQAITLAGGPAYEYVQIDPVDGRDGGAPGGNIRNAFLFDPGRVAYVPGSAFRITDAAATPADDGAFSASRKPLVADFVFNGQQITLVNNHFTSKSGSDPLYGASQPPLDRGIDQRAAQAELVKDFVQSRLAADVNAKVVVLGDLNDFTWKPALQVLTAGADAPLTDLAEATLPANERYSYVFEGNAQALDHLLVTDALLPGAVLDEVHINAEFASQTSDHDPSVAALVLAVPPAFPNGVSSGDVDDDSAVLWALVSVLGEAIFELTGADGTSVVIVLDVVATNVPLKLEINGLTADTAYSFTVTDSLGRSATGSFETAAAVGSHTGLSFGVTGDWRGELAPYPAIANADTAGLKFFVKLGDTIYADYASPAVPKPQAETIGEYRAKHAEVYADAYWQALQASTPIVAMIDDHEVTNDFAGGAPAASDPRTGATTGLVNDSPLYEAGLRVFQEYNAVEDRFYGATGDARTEGERDLYRYTTYGSDAATFLLDARSFRDQELADWNGTAPDAARFLTQAFNPTRTMLGEAQIDRLFADLLAAEQAGIGWKFIFVPEPIQNLGPLAAADRFEGYAAERTRLLKFIDENDIGNVVFVSADVHGTVVNNLTYQESPFGPQKAIDAFEITTGSVAFTPPFGPAAIGAAAAAGLVSASQLAFYSSLPVAPDSDSLVNDKDDFFKLLLNQQLDLFGYDRVGLNDTLSQASGLINARLLAGDYVAVHSFGWTRFDIDDASGALTVTTHGITDSNDIAQAPAIVSQFVVQKYATAPVLAFDLWRDSVSADRGVADWRDAAANLDYSNAAVTGEQRSALFNDSTGAKLARFLAADGDVAIRGVDFISGASVGGNAMSIDWEGGNAVLSLNTAWNSIQNVYLTEFAGGQLSVRNFVSTVFNFSTGTAAARDYDLLIQGSSRVNGRTGSGDDHIVIEVDSDGGPLAENKLVLTTDAGNDSVEIRASAFDWSGSLSPVPYDPQWTRTIANLGDGDDTFLGGDGTDIVTGGRGNDLLDGRGGYDIAVFAGSRAGYALAVLDTASGLSTVSGADGTDQVVRFEQLRFDDGVLKFLGGIWV
jgi:predicted extracellular nuclease/phosphodiesterase/alkaline phosphatase D-like protein